MENLMTPRRQLALNIVVLANPLVGIAAFVGAFTGHITRDGAALMVLVSLALGFAQLALRR